MPTTQSDLQFILMLSERLERISADSIWAHRASGIRGALLRALDELEKGETVPKSQLEVLTTAGFHILENMSKENTRRNAINRQ